MPKAASGGTCSARTRCRRRSSSATEVVLREPESGKLITHRVQSVIWHGELADVVTRGDANEVGENWSLSASDRVGEVVLRVPRVGYAVGLLATPAGRLGLAGVAVVLGLWILVVLWRPQRDDGTDGVQLPSPVPGPALARVASS